MRRAGWGLLLEGLPWVASCGGGGGGGGDNNTPPPPQTATYSVTAWSELGMHCMDGKDYSVFAVLPPYNTLHAQVVKHGDPPTLVSNVNLTYQAITDSTGSINTSSARKTNFWTYVQTLFGASPAPDIGLAGSPTQSNTPHAMTYNAAAGAWEAVGIPTVPFDDASARNPISNGAGGGEGYVGNVLASTTAVLDVSDEMTCFTCHASGSNSAAEPAAAGRTTRSGERREVQHPEEA